MFVEEYDDFILLDGREPESSVEVVVVEVKVCGAIEEKNIYY